MHHLIDCVRIRTQVPIPERIATVLHLQRFQIDAGSPYQVSPMALRSASDARANIGTAVGPI